MKGARLVLGLSLCGQALAEVPTLPIKAASMSNKRGLPRRPAAQGTNHGVGALAVSTTTTAAVLSARPALSLATAARGGGGAVLAASGSGVINGFLLAMVCGTAWAYLKVRPQQTQEAVNHVANDDRNNRPHIRMRPP